VHLISADIAIQLAHDHHREDLARAAQRRRLRRRPPAAPRTPLDAA
jgi:hypothetical protein